MSEHNNERQPYKTAALTCGANIEYFAYRSCGRTGVPGLDEMFWTNVDFIEANVDGHGHVMLFRYAPEEIDFSKATARVTSEIAIPTKDLKPKNSS